MDWSTSFVDVNARPKTHDAQGRMQAHSNGSTRLSHDQNINFAVKIFGNNNFNS